MICQMLAPTSVLCAKRAGVDPKLRILRPNVEMGAPFQIWALSSRRGLKMPFVGAKIQDKGAKCLIWHEIQDLGVKLQMPWLPGKRINFNSCLPHERILLHEIPKQLC